VLILVPVVSKSKKTMGFFRFNFISVYFIESPQRTQRTQRVI
jgi:hypothetical protein